MASFPRIAVLDIDGQEALRYLKLDENQYYGGTTHDDYRRMFPFAYGPHVMLSTAGMLDLLAAIANQPARDFCSYVVQGGDARRFDIQKIGREMHAGRLATILCVPEQIVRDHYDRIVLVKEATDG